MRFIAAIPNFNSGSSLVDLVKDLLKEGFDTIFVLDDASTDNSLDNLGKISNRVVIVRGLRNLGPAGNRNRLLGEMRPNDYICFIDADMEFLNGDFRKKILSIFELEKTIGIIGGLIMSNEDKPMKFNYGHHSNILFDSFGFIFEFLGRLFPWSWWHSIMTSFSKPFTFNLQIRYHFPIRQEADWVSEGFCFIRGDVFKEVGGFNKNLRYHEGQDLAQRFMQAGYESVFIPIGRVKHRQILSRPNLRQDRYSSWWKLRHK